MVTDTEYDSSEWLVSWLAADAGGTPQRHTLAFNDYNMAESRLMTMRGNHHVKQLALYRNYRHASSTA